MEKEGGKKFEMNLREKYFPSLLQPFLPSGRRFDNLFFWTNGKFGGEDKAFVESSPMLPLLRNFFLLLFSLSFTAAKLKEEEEAKKRKGRMV